jgi:hypothetical protein
MSINRRDLLKMAFPVGAASVALLIKEDGKPAVELDVSVLKCQPGDVIVLSCPGPISQEHAERIKAYFEQAFPILKAIVMSDGLKVDGVIRT